MHRDLLQELGLGPTDRLQPRLAWPLSGDGWDTQMLFFLQHGVMAPWATWRAASSALRIHKVADLLELLQRPRRGGYQPKGEPAPDDRRRHIAHGSCSVN
jgi:hypothetical protein